MSFRLCFSFLVAGIGVLPLVRFPSAAADTTPDISAPVVHENVAVYFVHGTSAPGPVPVTLQEALARGTVEVLETGNVRELEIENKGDEPVFVQFGDLVKGGRQDRVLTVSLVLPPKSGRMPIGSYCVEQGRWAARGLEDSKTFSRSEMLMPSREAKVAMVRPSGKRQRHAAGAMFAERDRVDAANVQRQRPWEGEQRIADGGRGAANSQGEVWRSVGAVQNKLSALLSAPVSSEKSRTSLQLALENDKLKAATDAYIDALEPAGLAADDVIGVAFAVNGRVFGADMYPSNGLFRKMWPKLVRAAATEALANKGKDAASAPAPEAVVAFLAEAEKGEQSQRNLGAYARLEMRDADTAVRMEARGPGGMLVHRNYLAK